EPQEAESPSHIDPRAQGTDSSMNKGMALVSSEEEGDSGLDLGATMPPSGGASGRLVVHGEVEPPPSGLDLPAAAVDIPEATNKATPSHGELALIMEESSDVKLGDQPKANGDRPSGRDLIAEAVESGVDLA